MLEATFGPQGGLTEPQQLVVCWSSHMRPKHEILKNCPLHSSTVDSKKESWSSFAIRMQHWRRPATDGAEFWISCKRPAFLSSFSRLQVIQNKRPWCRRRHIWQLDEKNFQWALGNKHIMNDPLSCSYSEFFELLITLEVLGIGTYFKVVVFYIFLNHASISVVSFHQAVAKKLTWFLHNNDA